MVIQSNDQRERVRSGWCFTRPVRRFGEQLMSQQLWCWGQDVKYREGNLLMQYGFQRHRESSAEVRSTCYRLQHDAGQIALWGFGMFFGHRKHGGVYLRRYDFRPLWAPIEMLSLGIQWPQDLPPFRRPTTRSQWRRAHGAWRAALCWIAQYEAWVSREFGREYRRACVEEWLHPFVIGDRMASAWRYLAHREWERTSTEFTQAVASFRVPQART